MAPEREGSPSLKDFKGALSDSPVQAAALLEAVHAADIADWLEDIAEDDASTVFRALDTEVQAEVLEHLDETLRGAIVTDLSATALREIVEELPSDEAVDVLADAEDHVAEDVLSTIPSDLAQELRELGAYPPESAGGVMTTDFVSVKTGTRLGDAIKAVKKEEDQPDEGIGVYVVDENDAPVGYLSNRALLMHSIHSEVDEYMVNPFTVEAAEDQEEAANLLTKYALQALAVVDPAGKLIGVITTDDAQEILESEVEEDILRLVGTVPTQLQTRLPVLRRVSQRMPLMAVTVMGGLLTAKILAYFSSGDPGAPVSINTAILRYLPLIIGLAGNVGIQSSTILVRGFATGEVEPEREGAVLLSEFTVGSLIGLICGGITTLVAGWLEADSGIAGLGGAVGTAVAAAVSWAALLGCVVPMSCRRLGIDPAIVAGPFLISLSDISGSAIYIIVARWLVS